VQQTTSLNIILTNLTAGCASTALTSRPAIQAFLPLQMGSIFSKLDRR
jgi:hypothetical protein